jgi:glycosyltransferase 2 family protein
MWVGFAISGVALVLTLRNVDFRQLLAALAGAQLVWLLPAAFFWVVCYFARARRWSLFMGDTPFWMTVHAQNIGYLLNGTLPFRLGEVARAYVIGQKTRVSMTRALSSIIVERVLDLAAVVGMFAVFAQYIPMPPTFSRAAFGGGVLVFVILVMGGLFVWKADVAEARVIGPILRRISPAVAEKVLPKLHEVTTGFRVVGSGRKMAVVLVLTILVWGGMTVFTYFTMLAFLPAKMEAAGLTVVSANLGGALPSAPGGLGIVQGFATTALVAPFKIPEEPALAFVFVWSLGQQLLLIVMGLISLARVGMTFSQVRHGTPPAPANGENGRSSAKTD